MRREKREEKKKRIIKYIIVLLLLLIILTTTRVVLAKFAAFARATNNARVARFSAVLKKENDSELTSNFEYNLAKTVTGGENLSKNGIVPGKSGKIDIYIDLSGSEVAGEYSIYLNSKTEDIPKNLKFYKDSTMTQEITLGDNAILTGKIDNVGEAKETSIYWKWNFVKSENENSYEGKDLKFDLKISVKQSDT